MHRGIPTLVVIVLCALGLAYWGWQTGKPAPDPALVVTARPMPAEGWGPMRVMTANIRLDEPSDGDNGWVHRRALLVKTVLKYQPEVLACQEVSPAQGAYLRKQLATWYDYYPRGGIGAADSAGGTTTAGATRSAASEILGAFNDSLASLNTIYFRSDRFDIVDGEAGLVLPDQPQANPTENTFFSLAVLREHRDAATKAPNPGTLIVVDVHFRHVEAFAVRCADRLEEKIAGWQGKYPQSGLILLGDINFDRTSRLYAELTAARAEKAASGPWDGMRDLFDYDQTPAGGVGAGANNGGNYHNFTGQTNRAWPTDLIFFGGGLRMVGAAEIVRDKGTDGRYPSDHFFTMGTVGW